MEKIDRLNDNQGGDGLHLSHFAHKRAFTVNIPWSYLEIVTCLQLHDANDACDRISKIIFIARQHT